MDLIKFMKVADLSIRSTRGQEHRGCDQCSGEQPRQNQHARDERRHRSKLRINNSIG